MLSPRRKTFFPGKSRPAISRKARMSRNQVSNESTWPRGRSGVRPKPRSSIAYEA